jgi:sec-independent protein translocase protein TatC
MSVAGVLGLFRANPRYDVGDGGRMALADHLRELRARILRAALALVIGTTVAWFFYQQIFALIKDPYDAGRQALGQDVHARIIFNSVTDPLMIQLKISALAAVVATSPYWLYQIWAFIVPGLHPNERRWTRLFVAAAGPLFVCGVAIGYYVMPKAMQVLIGFTPDNVELLTDFSKYFTFLTRMLLVFGVAFEIPLFVVLLNLAGVLSGRMLANHRPWIVVGVFVFAAVATPSTDPFSMLMLAIPMTLLFLVSEVIARVVDRRRGRRVESYADLDDETASPLDDPGEHYRASNLDEDD